MSGEDVEPHVVDLDAVISDADDDKTFAAMGVAKTIGTVKVVF